MTHMAPTPSRSVASDQGRELVAHWFVALVMNGMFGGVAVGILIGEVRTEPALEWLLLGIAALGPLLLVHAVVATVRWLRFRGVVLELDPVPGSLGGEVGGRILLPLRRLRAEQCSVSLSCIRVREGSDSTFESTVWSVERRPWLAYGRGGMEVAFAFAPPADLPPSSADGSVTWVVRLVADVPGIDLDLTFPVEVAETPEPLHSSVDLLPASEPTSWGGRDARLGPGIRVDRTGGALVFRYGVRRSLSMGIALGVFGALCLGSGTFIFRTTFRGGYGLFELVFSGMGLLFLLVFGLVGLALSLIALNLIFTTRRIEVTARGFAVRWRFLLLTSGKEISIDEVDRIAARVMGQSGQGARASVRYEIKAHLKTGGSVILGDGSRGPAHLDRIIRLIEAETGTRVEVEHRPPLHAGIPQT